MAETNRVSSVRQPPAGILSQLRFLGPGFILSAAVVGSGELIATTALGARTGFLLLWVILCSCFVKVAVQVEYGRYCITHGLPSFQGWNTAKGPRVLTVHWSVYGGLLFLLSAFISAAGIMGAAAQVLVYAFPRVGLTVWIVVIGAGVALLVFHGRYRPVEIVAGSLNLVFVSSILYCSAAVQRTPYAFSLSDLAGGLAFQLPPEGLLLAAAVFGITGVGAGEIVMYPYWCLEKGYAAWSGPRDDSAEWSHRARGWIRVMKLDAVLAMIAYTLVTCGFYFLGASLLHTQANLADGNELVLQLSRIYTGVLGDGSRTIFMVCAFTVLFSSLFSNTAGLTRLWTDILGIFGIVDTRRPSHCLRTMAVVSWVLPAVWAMVYLAVQKPLLLVIFMGIANAFFLLIVAWQAVVFRYLHADSRLTPSAFYDVALWLSVGSIGLVAWKLLLSFFQ